MTRKIPVRYVFPLLAAGMLLAAAGSVGSGEPSPPGDVRVSQVCLDCHQGQDSTLAATAHRLPGGAEDSPQARVACTDCHAGDRRHWEEDPTQNPMTKPSAADPATEARLCSSCHQNTHQQNMLEKNVHPRHGVNCSGCHSVHGSKQAALLKQKEPGLCLSCHTRVEGQFAKPFRHPVNDGIVKCSECHLTLDETRRELSLNGINNTCTRCHGEFEGPFPYEHQATVDYSTEEGGCLTCHEPHGSHVERMLKQPYESPHFQLCSQCHSVPSGHNQNVMHGTRWAGMPCSECHTDIHGSYTNRLFLGDWLMEGGCSNVGCHQF